MTWPIDLSQPPKVAALAKNVHGFLPSEKFLLRDLWSLHLYRYSGELVVQGQALPIQPGHAAIVPPGVENEYRYQGVSAHLYVHFRLGSSEPDQQVPAMQDLGERFQPIYERLAAVIGRTEAHVNALVWDALWELACPPQVQGSLDSTHPAVALVARLIEERFSQPLRVSQLAQEAEVTPSYLTRLFRQAYGDSVLEYLRRKRLDRALHLLRNSTLAIKSIATTVGYPDLQHFNKVIRVATGHSPKSVRIGTPVAHFEAIDQSPDHHRT